MYTIQWVKKRLDDLYLSGKCIIGTIIIIYIIIIIILYTCLLQLLSYGD